MTESRKISFGNLDQICNMLESAQAELLKAWDSEQYRMTPHEVKRYAQYLSRIRVSHVKSRDVLKLFEALLPAIIEGNKARQAMKESEPGINIAKIVGTPTELMSKLQEKTS